MRGVTLPTIAPHSQRTLEMLEQGSVGNWGRAGLRIEIAISGLVETPFLMALEVMLIVSDNRVCDE